MTYPFLTSLLEDLFGRVLGNGKGVVEVRRDILCFYIHDGFSCGILRIEQITVGSITLIQYRDDLVFLLVPHLQHKSKLCLSYAFLQLLQEVLRAQENERARPVPYSCTCLKSQSSDKISDSSKALTPYLDTRVVVAHQSLKDKCQSGGATGRK